MEVCQQHSILENLRQIRSFCKSNVIHDHYISVIAISSSGRFWKGTGHRHHSVNWIVVLARLSRDKRGELNNRVIHQEKNFLYYTKWYIFTTVMDKLQSKAERTKAFILQKAGPLFNTKGYAGTSLHDLTDATRLTKGALYGNFENKEQLAEEAFAFNFQWLKKGFSNAAKQRENAVDKLLAVVNFSRYGFEQLSAMGGCPVLNASVEADDQLPFLQKKVREALSQWRSLLETIIKDGKTVKEIEQSIAEAQYASLFISLTEGAIMQARITGQTKHLHFAMDRIEKIIKEELAR